MTRDARTEGRFIQRGGWWVVAQNSLFLAVLALGPAARGQWHSGAASIAGGVLMSIGGCLAIAGVWALGRNLTPYPKPRENSALVQRGVYALVRHPLYGSLIFFSAGWALKWSSGLALAASVLLAIVLDAKARREERWLREKFPGYAAYSRRVRRLLPWVY
jgi:protein-S-isoprenylcysteine O-methyltransferase Ste14